MGFLVALFGLLLTALGIGLLVASRAYARHPMLRELRETQATLRELKVTCAKVAKEGPKRESSLVEAFSSLQQTQARRALDAMPLDDLATKGVGDGTIARLRDAGFTRVSDVAGRRARAIKGIGPDR